MWISRVSYAAIFAVIAGCTGIDPVAPLDVIADHTHVCATTALDRVDQFADVGVTRLDWTDPTMEYQSGWLTPTYHGTTCGKMIVVGVRANSPADRYHWLQLDLWVGTRYDDLDCGNANTTWEVWS